MRTPMVRRGSSPSWMRPVSDRLSPTIRNLIIVDALLFLFYAVVEPSQVFFTEHLALGPAFLRGEIWQIATSLFVHLDFLSFAFNVIGLWFVGATIERNLGTRRFLILFFATGLAANLVLVLLSAQLGRPEIFAGCGSAVLALFVAFGVVYGRSQARILGGLVMQARTLAMILVGFAIFANLTRGSWAGLAGDLVAVTLGYALSGGRGEALRELLSWRPRRPKRRYEVLDGGRAGRSRPPADLN